MSYICLVPLGVQLLLILGVLAGLLLQLPLTQIQATLASQEIHFALRLTLLTSLGATVIALLLGVPSGYFLARVSFRGKAIVDTLIDLPMTMTPMVTGVGLLFVLGNPAVGKVLNLLGVEFLFTPLGAILAQVLITAPIMTRTCKTAFTATVENYEKVAQTMGLTPFQVFFRISLPMARPIILSALVLCWTRAVGEFGATLMVAGATRLKTETLPIAVYLNISSGELGVALLCAWLLILTGFVGLLLMRWLGAPLDVDNSLAKGGQ